MSPKKFLIGTSMKYGGFPLKAIPNVEVQILPDENRLRDLLNVSSPGTKQELLSFLGMINCLKTWSPALSCHTKVLRDLAKEDITFFLE